MKSIVVTGASSGIGKAVAERFLHEGWQVGLLARRGDVLDVIADGKKNALALVCDVTSITQVSEAFEAHVAHFGRIDVLFNNAGVFTPAGMIDEVSIEDWATAVAVNLSGMFYCARAAFSQMRRQSPRGGRIINNGSISAHAPRDGAVTYTTTKHGITGLTRQLALDGRAFDIACGQIDIGNARTPLLDEIAERARASNHPEPPSFDIAHVADAVFGMADLPLSTNVLFQTIMATNMPFVGRG